jgi:hypothetical protein
LQSAREIVEFGVEAVVALAAIEEGGDRADLILVIARVEQEPFLPMQFGRATAAIDIALAYDKHSFGWIRDPGGFAALHPIPRHDDDKKFCPLEPIVDNVGELIALADAAAIAPDIRLSRPRSRSFRRSCWSRILTKPGSSGSGDRMRSSS